LHINGPPDRHDCSKGDVCGAVGVSVTRIEDATDPSAVDDAVNRLGAGEVVAIPTDTVYGLAVSAFVPGAIDQLFVAKERPHTLEIPVLVSAAAGVAALIEGEIPGIAQWWMDRFWPGALTIVLPRRTDLVDVDLGGDGSTIGLRCPDHRLVRELCRRVGPLATTSANLHGEPTPQTAAGVAAALDGAVSLVLDGGTCEGAPSTVVAIDATGAPSILREGRIPTDTLTPT